MLTSFVLLNSKNLKLKISIQSVTQQQAQNGFFDSPQEPPSARLDLVSAVMAGKVPIVMVNIKQTDRANSQI